MSDPAIRVVAAVVWRDDQILMTQRPEGGALGSMWEFPGGKLEPGETSEAALVRELYEELGVGAQAGECLATTRHVYPHGLTVEIQFIRCQLDSHQFAPSPAVAAARWVRPADVDLDQVLAADREFVASLARVRTD